MFKGNQFLNVKHLSDSMFKDNKTQVETMWIIGSLKRFLKNSLFTHINNNRGHLFNYYFFLWNMTLSPLHVAKILHRTLVKSHCIVFMSLLTSSFEDEAPLNFTTFTGSWWHLEDALFKSSAHLFFVYFFYYCILILLVIIIMIIIIL